MSGDGPTLSVVIPTFNRPHLLARLLQQLADQSLPPHAYEVIVVDDGSSPPVRNALESLRLPYPLRLCLQANAGPASARDRGVQAANGELIVFLDDDMQVGRAFLEAHQARFLGGRRRAVVGRIRPGANLARMPLFERWHAHQLEVLADRLERGELRPRGNHFFTGNASLRRDDYLAVGGFDHALGHSEDAELGLRLEAAGVRVEFAPEAWALHDSDRAQLEGWLRRSRLYGVFDQRIARKHPGAWHANPWRFLFELHPLTRPLLAGSLLAPAAADPLARAIYLAAAALDRAGLRGAALAATSASFAVEYYRGLREEVGGFRQAAHELLRYAASLEAAPPESLRCALGQVRRFAQDVRADHQTVRHYERRHGHARPSRGRVVEDLVQKIGFQLLASYRLMRLLRDAGFPTAAKVLSRLMRHLYGSDIHWDATLEPGVLVVHGMGMAIHAQAHVASGCILFQNVTLGAGLDPLTREPGAPRLEENVHVGPGATLLGPITVGARSKIMAGAVLRRSVPPGSLVAAPSPEIRARGERPRPPPPGGRNVADPSRPIKV